MSQKKLITVLGTGKYSETKYRLDSNHETVETRFFPVAVAKWFKPNEIYVLLTEQARNHENWQGCKENLAQFMSEEKIHEVSIPEGKSEEELWQIFDAITKVVQEGDEIILDITHGFRSLPLLAMLAVAYLRQVRGVSQVQILYGAYEAGNQRKSPQPEARQASPHKAPESETQQSQASPAFDLTPFVSLLDWLTAAKIFMETGDGRELAKLMQSPQDQAHPSGEQVSNAPKKLKTLGRTISNLSENLLLSRVPALTKSAQKLSAVLENEQLFEEVETWLPPLKPLFQQIQQKYAPFAQDDLHTQLELVRWYRDHGHFVQAYTLAREWVVNYELYRQGKWESLTDKDVREAIEAKLNELARSGDVKNTDGGVLSLWRTLAGYRNDIAHCGYRKDRIRISKLKGNLESLLKEMQSLLDKGS